MLSSTTAWKRDNLRVSLSSAPSIEETGLDYILYGEGFPFFTPHETLRKTTSMPAESISQGVSTSRLTTKGFNDENYFDAPDVLPKENKNNSTEEGLRKRNRRLNQRPSSSGIPVPETSPSVRQILGGRIALDGRQGLAKEKIARTIPSKLLGVSEAGEDEVLADGSLSDTDDVTNGISTDGEAQLVGKHGSVEHGGNMPRRERSVRFRLSAAARSDPFQATDTTSAQGADEYATKSHESVHSLDGKSLANMTLGGNEGSSDGFETALESVEMPSKQSTTKLSGVTSPSGGVGRINSPSTIGRAHTAFSAELRLKPDPRDVVGDRIENREGSLTAETEERSFEPDNVHALPSPSNEAQARWRRAKTKLAFVHHLSEGHRRAVAGEFLNDRGEEETVQHVKSGDTGKGEKGVEGARLRREVQGAAGQIRAKGRRGQEGMVVRQHKGMITLVQDFYVACLKMPIGHFLIGVFLAPIALGLFFTPIYLLGKGGLSFNGGTSTDESIMVGRAAKAKQNISDLMDVFLYALSLSTTFGGSPVAALSTYCLIVANMNTLMGQFLFVFLSGAVFARMSQPSQPIRCSKKAVIRADDFTSLPSAMLKDKPKVFAVRLVLTGPPPCELVDAKICLTFRILIKLPTGSMFCSTQDLSLVRPEISYLRYGILVRHVIDSKSPIYGHTMESLMDGDASFSLTIMGLERASMQPIFHLEDYFVCDGDVAWDADYIDFIHIDKAGNRVLDHSKLDLITTEDTKMGGKRKDKREEEETLPKDDQASIPGVKAGLHTRSKSTAWRAKSNSFTRADR